jgi:hypothetical protein
MLVIWSHVLLCFRPLNLRLVALVLVELMIVMHLPLHLVMLGLFF